MDCVGPIDALSGPSHARLGSYRATTPAIIMPVMLNLCLAVYLCPALLFTDCRSTFYTRLCVPATTLDLVIGKKTFFPFTCSVTFVHVYCLKDRHDCL